jgi:hypothetical protein
LKPAPVAVDAELWTLSLPEVVSVPSSASVGFVTPLVASSFFSSSHWTPGRRFGFGGMRQPYALRPNPGLPEVQ